MYYLNSWIEIGGGVVFVRRGNNRRGVSCFFMREMNTGGGVVFVLKEKNRGGCFFVARGKNTDRGCFCQKRKEYRGKGYCFCRERKE